MASLNVQRPFHIVRDCFQYKNHSQENKRDNSDVPLAFLRVINIPKDTLKKESLILFFGSEMFYFSLLIRISVGAFILPLVLLYLYNIHIHFDSPRIDRIILFLKWR